jgi:hypothetical protein
MTFQVERAPELNAVIVNDGSPQRSRVGSLTLQFSKDVSASLALGDLALRNTSTGALIAAPDLALRYEAATNRAVLSFPALPGQRLAQGNYRLSVAAAGVTDQFGLRLAADFVFDFFVLTGDANGNRVVNDLDLYEVWQNLLKPAAARDLNEDLTGDGQVTSADVSVVRGNYLATLPPAAELATAAEEVLLIAEAPSASPADGQKNPSTLVVDVRTETQSSPASPEREAVPDRPVAPGIAALEERSFASGWAWFGVDPLRSLSLLDIFARADEWERRQIQGPSLGKLIFADSSRDTLLRSPHSRARR